MLASVGGKAKDGLFSQQITGHPHGQVVLTQVNSMGSGSQGKIDAVVDQKLCSQWLA